MKKTVITVINICIIVTMVILSIRLGERTFSGEQLSTLKTLLIVCGAAIAYCFFVGEITHNYSQMDKLWSILPIAYVWIVAARAGADPRILIYALIVTAWGIRLTINFARKGAYSIKFWEGTEDYRWSIVRQFSFFKNDLMWTLFNLFFISTYQNLLVLAICLPAVACMGSGAGLGIIDLIACVTSVSFLILETVSDEYQWRFHQTKKKMLTEGRELADLPAPYDLGFNTTGPWGYMRHPNYLGEQGMWVCLYLFAVGSGCVSHGFFNITFVGPLMLVLLFMGSSMLGEKISSGKYPMYADYVDKVNKYIPLARYDSEG